MSPMTFEKALAELENIVSQMEKGGLSLSDSLALFERGVKLARFLREELEKAEKKVEILLKNEKGELKAAPFELGEITSALGEREEPEENSGEEEPL